MKCIVNDTLLHMVLDVSSLRGRNWGKYVFDAIIQGVRDYKTTKRQSVNGCILVLMVTYFYLINVDWKASMHFDFY